MILKKMDPRGRFAPQTGAIYIHIHYHNIQRSFCLKQLGQSKPKPIKAKLHVEHSYEGRIKVYVGQMTKMAVMAINSKNLLKSSTQESESL